MLLDNAASEQFLPLCVQAKDHCRILLCGKKVQDVSQCRSRALSDGTTATGRRNNRALERSRSSSIRSSKSSQSSKRSEGKNIGAPMGKWSANGVDEKTITQSATTSDIFSILPQAAFTPTSQQLRWTSRHGISPFLCPVTRKCDFLGHLLTTFVGRFSDSLPTLPSNWGVNVTWKVQLRRCREPILSGSVLAKSAQDASPNLTRQIRRSYELVIK